MKFAILNDTHCGVRNDNVQFHEYQRKFYEDIFFPYLLENDIKHIVHLGDYFDKRTGINFLSLQKNKEHFIDHLVKYDISMDLILGNHDLYYKNTSEVNSPQSLLEGKAKIEIYGDIITKDYDGLLITLVPWIHRNNIEETVEHIELTKGQVAMGHLEIEGAMMMPGYYSSHGMNLDTFKRFEQVYSGHFHTKSEMGNLRYLGAQMQFTWNDFGDIKSFHIYNTDDRSIFPVVNPITMFEKVFYDDSKWALEDIQGMEFSDLTDKFVKVIVQSKDQPYWFDMYIDKITKANPIDLKIVEDHGNIDLLNDDEALADAEDTLTILTKHIDQMEISGDKTKLDTLMRSLYTEALDTSF